MTVKQAFQQISESLPEDTDWEEAEERLYTIRKIQEGEEAFERGEFSTQEETRAHIARCLER